MSLTFAPMKIFGFELLLSLCGFVPTFVNTFKVPVFSLLVTVGGEQEISKRPGIFRCLALKQVTDWLNECVCVCVWSLSCYTSTFLHPPPLPLVWDRNMWFRWTLTKQVNPCSTARLFICSTEVLRHIFRYRTWQESKNLLKAANSSKGLNKKNQKHFAASWSEYKRNSVDICFSLWRPGGFPLFLFLNPDY